MGLRNLRFHEMFFFSLQIPAAAVLSMSRNKNWYFFRQNKDKCMWWGSSLLHFQYTNQDTRQTGESCHTQVSGVSQEFLKTFMYFKQTGFSSPSWFSSISSKYSRPLARSIKSRCNFSTWVCSKNSKFIASMPAPQWCCD